MDLALSGKVVVVTGASRGLGAASARLLAAEGARLALTARGTAETGELAAEVKRRHGVEALCLAADLTSEKAANEVAAKTIAAFGRIDVLINCAGAAQGGLFWEIDDRVWQEAFDLKVMGTVRMMRAVIPHMVAQRYGRIVNVVGNTGRQPSARLIPGSAANAALLAITRGVVEDLAAHNIVVNAVNPGPTRTERWNTLMARQAATAGLSVPEIERGYTTQIPRGALAEPDEIAGLIVFLASDRAANMTGTAVTADGGWSKGLG